MAEVFVSIGSNINRRYYISVALDALAAEFAPLTVSPVYESESVGFKGDAFFNLVVGFSTDKSVSQLQCFFKTLENANGRIRGCEKFSARTLDIDILTYDDYLGVVDEVVLPREEILYNAFVLLPLSDIAAHQLHPGEGKSYAQLWAEYDHRLQKIWRVNFAWQGQIISSVG